MFAKGQKVIAPIKGVERVATVKSVFPHSRDNSVTYVVVADDDKKGEGYGFGPAALRAA